MNRAELERVIWTHWPSRHPLTGTPVDPDEASTAVDAILAAADQYGEDKYGITAERRAVLARDNPVRRTRKGAAGG